MRAIPIDTRCLTVTEDTGFWRARRESQPRRAELRVAGARWRVAASNGTAAIRQQRKRDTGRWVHGNDRSEHRGRARRDSRRPHVREQTTMQATRLIHDAPTTHTQETTATVRNKHMGGCHQTSQTTTPRTVRAPIKPSSTSVAELQQEHGTSTAVRVCAVPPYQSGRATSASSFRKLG